MKPQKKEFKPQNLRSILATLLIVLLLGGGAAFYWGLGIVREYAATVNQRLADAEASGAQIQELQTLKNQLAQSNSLVKKANQLFATPASYQSRVLADLKNYADSAGLSITDTSFSPANESASHSITITLEEPVSYTKLITFLNNVESSIPKLQVSSITLGQATGGNADSVDVEDIKINISVR